ETILEDREDQGAKECARNCPRSSLERCSADDCTGYSSEHNLCPTCQGINRGDAKRFKDASKASECCCQHKVDQFHPVHVDAYLTGADQVAPCCNSMQSPARSPKDHLHDGDDDNGPDDLRIGVMSHDLIQVPKIRC